MSLTRLQLARELSKIAKELSRIAARGTESYCECNSLINARIITPDNFVVMQLKENDCRAALEPAEIAIDLAESIIKEEEANV